MTQLNQELDDNQKAAIEFLFNRLKFFEENKHLNENSIIDKNQNIINGQVLIDQTQIIQPSFTKSLLKPAITLEIYASNPTQEERLSICKSCEFYKNESGEPSCGQCGCPLKEKISIAEESCPLKKWIPIKTQSSGGCGVCGKK